MNWWPASLVVSLLHFVIAVVEVAVEHLGLVLIACLAIVGFRAWREAQQAKHSGSIPPPPAPSPWASQTNGSRARDYITRQVVRWGSVGGSRTTTRTSREGETDRIDVQGVRSGNTASVNLPADLTSLRVEKFLDAVQQWAGPGCHQIAFHRGRCTVVDQVGLALRRRGYDVRWVNGASFTQSGWLAIVG